MSLSLDFNGAMDFFSQAAENYRQAVKLAPKRSLLGSYLVLWYAMSAERAGALDRTVLEDAASNFSSGDWPAPVLDFYRGKVTVDTVYREAENRDAQTAVNQKCESDFYVGEWRLAHKDASAAKTLLQQAQNACPKNFLEYSMAKVELERLP
jgi:lipoprotein NlpI